MQILHGKVIHGEKLGHKLGFPTANIACTKIDEPDSVFHINIVIDDEIYRGIGTHIPRKGCFEAHIFDFDTDIYGREIQIVLLRKLRDNRKFSSQKELMAQIQKDKKKALSQILNVLTFGSFDVLHPGHEHYLRQAKMYGTHLITIVATDLNIQKIKGKAPMYSMLERVEMLMQTNIPDEVIAGSNSTPLKWLELYSPTCICLGYDQRGKFVDALPPAIEKLGQEIEIIRISPLKPEIYKSSFFKKNKKHL